MIYYLKVIERVCDLGPSFLKEKIHFDSDYQRVLYCGLMVWNEVMDRNDRICFDKKCEDSLRELTGDNIPPVLLFKQMTNTDREVRIKALKNFKKLLKKE